MEIEADIIFENFDDLRFLYEEIPSENCNLTNIKNCFLKKINQFF